MTLDDVNRIGLVGAARHCGVYWVGLGDDWLEADIPLDARTRDVDGSLHPGSLAILAETIGSVAATLCIGRSRMCVGQILHVNHPAPVTIGPVRARATAASILHDQHVWDIEMKDPAGTVVCVARLAVAVMDRPDGDVKT